jgi:hypothetical protein
VEIYRERERVYIRERGKKYKGEIEERWWKRHKEETEWRD